MMCANTPFKKNTQQSRLMMKIPANVYKQGFSKGICPNVSIYRRL